ncbi:OmpW family outer membrane protein [Crenobacter sp. SG2303]|uniref:OmpW family outer membrane protein n=1 Tax=Crenobacter oryzisoli TaxID=3056844 RepID=A0ABT7XQ71_9NEIS|nr:OmpW family outer membrane protein [Crenobacter sp. SG2303]MDN0075937.1 OmpW family outer membrane protein [Crenobacter sp. SG2303]
MKKVLTLAVLSALGASSVFAGQGDLLARFRVINVDPDTKVDHTLSTLDVDADNQTVPELDFTYMVTDHIGAELILATSRHKVSSKLGDLGKVSALPPTVTLQYHFNPEGQIRPYVGAGVNYTRFYNVGLSSPLGDLTVDQNSWGPALQLGTDVAINKDWFVNADVKKIYMKTDVKGTSGAIAGANLGTLKLNPWVFGIGIGTKF